VCAYWPRRNDVLLGQHTGSTMNPRSKDRPLPTSSDITVGMCGIRSNRMSSVMMTTRFGGGGASWADATSTVPAKVKIVMHTAASQRIYEPPKLSLGGETYYRPRAMV
jgi:hypothetical protein